MCRRRMLLAGLGGLAGLAGLSLGGCAALLGPPTLTLDEADIARLLERHFPLERSLLDIFDVTVSAPRIRLQPERRRLAAVVDVRARNRLLGLSWQGRLHFDAALRWDASDQTVRLDQVRVQDLAFADPGALQRNTVERLGAALAERVLEGSAIYRLPPERAAQWRAKGFLPGSVDVTPRGLEIRFVPVPADPVR